MANIDTRPTSKSEHVCIVAVGSFVLLAGLFCIYAGVTLLWRGEYVDGAVFLALGSLFTLIGSGVIVAGSRWVRASRRLVARQAAHPREPWLWREDWRARRIAGNNLFWTGFFIVFAIIWNAISLPIAATILARGWLNEQGIMWIYVTVFPIAGVILIGAAIYFTRRLIKFGRTWFLLNNVPYRLGSTLEGKIMVARNRYMTSSVTIVVANRQVRLVQDPYNPRKTRTNVDVLWESAPITVPPGDFSRDGRAVMIPVRMPLPAAATATCIESGTDKIDWVLKAHSEVPGVNFKTEFEVPVF